MSDRSIGSQESIKRQECFRRLFLHEWRRRRITNKEMARRLGRSLSLINKIKACNAAVTPVIHNQLVAVLEIDIDVASFAIDILGKPELYFDPGFRQFVRWIVDVASNYDNAGEECATFMALASEVGSAPGAPSIFQKLLGDIQSPVATAS